MSQRISHVYSIVTQPTFYKGFQNVLGADKVRKTFIAEIVGATAPHSKVLDVGCGPATLLPYLGDVDYTGLDLNPKHIEDAKTTHGHSATFMCADAVTGLPNADGQFDVVIASGLLHHIDDDDAVRLLARLVELAKPGGRVCTIDPVRVDRQRVIAKSLQSLDSGKNIRNADGYRKLVTAPTLKVTTKLYHDLLRVPYDHIAIKIEKA